MRVRQLVAPTTLALAAALYAPAVAETLEEQVEAGAIVYAEQCAVCHGARGEGGAGYPNPIVDTSSLAKFQHARGLYDYMFMMMPFDDPSRVGSADKWRVTAWMMQVNRWLDGAGEPLGPDNANRFSIGE